MLYAYFGRGVAIHRNGNGKSVNAVVCATRHRCFKSERFAHGVGHVVVRRKSERVVIRRGIGNAARHNVFRIGELPFISYVAPKVRVFANANRLARARLERYVSGAQRKSRLGCRDYRACGLCAIRHAAYRRGVRRKHRLARFLRRELRNVEILVIFLHDIAVTKRGYVCARGNAEIVFSCAEHGGGRVRVFHHHGDEFGRVNVNAAVRRRKLACINLSVLGYKFLHRGYAIRGVIKRARYIPILFGKFETVACGISFSKHGYGCANSTACAVVARFETYYFAAVGIVIYIESFAREHYARRKSFGRAYFELVVAEIFLIELVACGGTAVKLQTYRRLVAARGKSEIHRVGYKLGISEILHGCRSGNRKLRVACKRVGYLRGFALIESNGILVAVAYPSNRKQSAVVAAYLGKRNGHIVAARLRRRYGEHGRAIERVNRGFVRRNHEFGSVRNANFYNLGRFVAVRYAYVRVARLERAHRNIARVIHGCHGYAHIRTRYGYAARNISERGHGIRQVRAERRRLPANHGELTVIVYFVFALLYGDIAERNGHGYNAARNRNGFVSVRVSCGYGKQSVRAR